VKSLATEQETGRPFVRPDRIFPTILEKQTRQYLAAQMTYISISFMQAENTQKFINAMGEK